MNFEAEIEKKMVTLLEATAYVTANDIGVVRFGKVRDVEKINKPFLVVTCENRVNLNGPLWNADIHIDVLVKLTESNDVTTVVDALNGVAGDFIDAIKANPSILTNAGYNVDGLTNIKESPRPELLQTLRAAFRDARLFISYQ